MRRGSGKLLRQQDQRSQGKVLRRKVISEEIYEILITNSKVDELSNPRILESLRFLRNRICASTRILNRP